MNLFCFPYAGGSSRIYKEWNSSLSGDINVIAYEMAGRAARMAEDSYKSQEDAVERILSEISSDLSDPYCFFGHSMGSTIVYLLLKEIKKRGLPEPEHVFLSGGKAPHLKSQNDRMHLLPEDSFIELLKSYGGTPSEFFENRELLDFFLPKLRNDFMLAVLGFEEIPEVAPLDIDFSILYGENEDLSEEQSLEWQKYTTGKCTVHNVSGTRFFIDEHPEEVIKIVDRTISSLISS